jgi:hypothetical protein
VEALEAFLNEIKAELPSQLPLGNIKFNQNFNILGRIFIEQRKQRKPVTVDLVKCALVSTFPLQDSQAKLRLCVVDFIDKKICGVEPPDFWHQAVRTCVEVGFELPLLEYLLQLRPNWENVISVDRLLSNAYYKHVNRAMDSIFRQEGFRDAAKLVLDYAVLPMDMQTRRHVAHNMFEFQLRSAFCGDRIVHKIFNLDFSCFLTDSPIDRIKYLVEYDEFDDLMLRKDLQEQPDSEWLPMIHICWHHVDRTDLLDVPEKLEFLWSQGARFNPAKMAKYARYFNLDPLFRLSQFHYMFRLWASYDTLKFMQQKVPEQLRFENWEPLVAGQIVVRRLINDKPLLGFFLRSYVIDEGKQLFKRAYHRRSIQASPVRNLTALSPS